MTLAVLIPVLNEQKTIQTVLKQVLKIKQVDQIVVVDDGSTDRSVQRASEIRHKKIRIFSRPHAGKGAALRFGLDQIKCEYVVIQDADLEYQPTDIPAMLAAVNKERGVEVIYGSRFLGPHTNLLFWHLMGNHLLNFLVNILYDTTLSDMETGYKLLPTALMRQIDLRSDGFEIEPEITCKVLRAGKRVFEVPITYIGRDFSQGKKITWKDGIRALVVIFRYRFFYRHQHLF